MSASTPSDFDLRGARLGDLAALLEIDDEAGALYAQHGLPLVLDGSHPFVVAERARWARAIEVRAAFVAEVAGRPVGFAALHLLDDEPYLDQVSVRPSHGRRGLGRALVRRGAAWARAQGGRRLWLTTYATLPFNAPFYRRLGFRAVAEQDWGPELRALLAAQRAALPSPPQRLAMRLELG